MQEELPGQSLARGARRCLSGYGFACLTEFTPRPGLRVDLIGVGPKGEIWVVECKSSRADYASDRKWRGYLDYADRFFWAVDADFPAEILPEDTGLIRADRFGGEVFRFGPETRLAAARRRALTQAFARAAAWRLSRLIECAPNDVTLNEDGEIGIAAQARGGAV